MRKTKYLVGTFLATALLIGGCSDSETVEETAPVENSQTQKLAGQRLTDDNGMEYTLIDNGDGTETARYDDGRSVTFQRQEDGSLSYLAGAAGLIAGMAAGYYLFHGFSSLPVRGTLQPIAIQFLNRCNAAKILPVLIQADLQAMQILRRPILQPLQIPIQRLICRKKVRLQALQVLPIQKLIYRKKVRPQVRQKADLAARGRVLPPRLKSW